MVSPPVERRIDHRGAIPLPSAARVLCRIDTGVTVILVADPTTGVLSVHRSAHAIALLNCHIDTTSPTGAHLADDRTDIDNIAVHPARPRS